jgi:hypothetical protein
MRPLEKAVCQNKFQIQQFSKLTATTSFTDDSVTLVLFGSMAAAASRRTGSTGGAPLGAARELTPLKTRRLIEEWGGKKMADGVATNWLDVLRSAFWPALALIALVLLHNPAVKLLDEISQGGAQEIEAGPVKIKFSPEGLRHVSPPSAAVADVLPKLTQGEVDALMSHAPNTSIPVCQPSALKIDSPDSRQEAFIYDRLFTNNLVSVEQAKPDDANASWCKIEGLKLAQLTGLGRNVRAYLLSVITSSITISAS